MFCARKKEDPWSSMGLILALVEIELQSELNKTSAEFLFEIGRLYLLTVNCP